MQFKNTSDVTLQTDTNQHDTRGELHAKLRNDGHLSATTRRQRGGRQRTAGVAAVPVADGRAWPDNESTRRAKLAARTAGGPPPTSTPSSPAPRATPRAGRPTRAHQAARPHNRVLHRPEHQRRHQHRPEHQRRNTPPRHSKAARPRRGRAAQPASEDHRRITTMSGLPRPLSWRTFEMPSFDAMSLAVPSMRGSS